MGNTTLADWNKKGFALNDDGKLVQAKKLVSKKVEKLPDLLEQGRNKKIMNAKKVTNEAGIHFDSLLEQHMHDLLQGAGIDFEFQKVYELQPKFKYNGKTVRAVTLTVDFYLSIKNIIIDTKGHQTQQGALRWKMLKKIFIDEWNCDFSYDKPNIPKIEMPRTNDECNLLLNRILFDK